MTGLTFYLSDYTDPIARGAVWAAVGVLALVAAVVFGALVLWPMCRHLSDTERTLQDELDAQIEQWRDEGRNVVLLSARRRQEGRG